MCGVPFCWFSADLENQWAEGLPQCEYLELCVAACFFLCTLPIIETGGGGLILAGLFHS